MVFIPGVESTHASQGNFGTQVAWDDGDYAPRFVNITSAFVGRVDNAAGCSDDVYYLHFGSSGETQTGSNDIILAGTGAGGFASAGITFAAAATDSFASGIRWMEADGKFGYSPGDLLYYSTGTTLDAVTCPGIADFALATVTTAAPLSYAATAGTIITSASNADIVNATATGATTGAGANGILPDDGDRGTAGAQFTGTGFTIQYADKNGNDVRDNNDVYKITIAGDPQDTFFNTGDTILATAGGYTYGTRVTSSTTKEIPVLTSSIESRAQFVYTVPTGTNDTTTRGYYIHFWDPDASNNTINIGDICLRDPAVSCTYGSRVTSTATGYGKTVGCKTPLQGVIFYIEADNIAGMTDGDNIYYNLPSTCFGGTADALTLTAGDLRANTIASPSFAAGTQTVTGNGDPGLAGATAGNPVSSRWYYQLYDEDKSSPVPMTALTNGKIFDANGNGGYDKGESVYVSSNSVVTVGDIRVHTGYAGNAQRGAKSSSNATGLVVASDFDVGATLTTPSLTYRYRLWVSGLDGTFDAGRSEYVYASNDSFVNWGDVRLLNHSASASTAANTTVGPLTGAAAGTTLSGWSRDMVQYGPGVSERTFLNWCRGGQSINAGGSADCLGGDGAPLLLHAYDAEVVSGGTRVSPTSAEHVPWLIQVRGAPNSANQTLLRYNRGDSGALTDDSFYLGLNPAGATQLQSKYLRIVGYDATRAAGKAVGTSTAETGASAGEIANGSVTFRQRIRFVDPDGNGYTKGDFVIVDNPSGSGGSNEGLYGLGDIRLTPTGASNGATSSPAGTIRVNAEPDQSLTAFGTPTSSRQFHLYWFDVNRDNTTSFEELGHDRLYAMYLDPTTLGQAGGTHPGNASERKPITPLLNSVRLVGGGGATAATGTATATGAAATTTATTATTTAATTAGTTAATTATTATTGATGTTGTGATNATDSTSASPTKTSKKGTPGFEAVGIAVATVGVALAMLRRRRDE